MPQLAEPAAAAAARRLEQLAQHEVEDAVVAVVEPLVRRVDAHACVEFDALRGTDPQRPRALLERREVEGLLARQAERLRRLAVWELERQDAHADEVRPV